MTHLLLNDGTRLYYSATGEGPATIVPCIQTSVPYERSVGQELTQGSQYIYIEPRGTSRSGGDTDISLDRIVKDIDDLRQILGLAQITLMGHSRNGFIAAHYAHKYPSVVTHLALVGTPMTLGANHDDYWEEIADDRRRTVAERNRKLLKSEQIDFNTGEGHVQKFNLESHLLWFDPEYDMTSWWDASLVSPTVSRRTTEEWSDFDLRKAVGGSGVPTFIGYGRFDLHAPPTTDLADLPNVTIEVFDRSGHFPYFEEAQDFANRYLRWKTNTRSKT